MKILQINNVYNFGRTGKITRDIHQMLLREGVESLVCYGRRYRTDDRNVVKICSEVYGKANNLLSRITGLPYGGCLLSTNKLIRIIRREKPDVVHLQCLNGHFVNIYRLIEFLKREQIPTVLTLHAEFMHTANCGYAYDCEKWKTGCGHCPDARKATGSYFFDRTHHSWARMKKAFEGFEKLTVVGVSEWITKRARESGMFEDARNIRCITNGINLENFDCDSEKHFEEDEAVANKYGLNRDRKIVLHVTSSLYSPFKGGKYFLELSESLPKEYQCVIVGVDAVENRPDLICIPFTTNQKELASLYRMADVFVITSTAENYPTVCLEAQACGTPVVGFDVGGVKETIQGGMGVCTAVFDIPAMKNAVMYWCGEQVIDGEALTNCRIQNSRERMVEDYGALYEEVLIKR